MNLYVNNRLADMDTKVYENFSVVWTMEELQLSDRDKYENELQDTFAELPEDDGTYQKNSTRSEMQAAENTQDPVRADSTDHDGASRGEGTKAAAEAETKERTA